MTGPCWHCRYGHNPRNNPDWLKCPPGAPICGEGKQGFYKFVEGEAEKKHREEEERG